MYNKSLLEYQMKKLRGEEGIEPSCAYPDINGSIPKRSCFSYSAKNMSPDRPISAVPTTTLTNKLAAIFILTSIIVVLIEIEMVNTTFAKNPGTFSNILPMYGLNSLRDLHHEFSITVHLIHLHYSTLTWPFISMGNNQSRSSAS